MNLVERARNIALTPRSEWEVIAPERTSAGELYKGYIVPLSAIGPIASFIGLTIFGVSVPFLGTHRVSFVTGLSSSLLSFALGLISVYFVALVIDALAPTFGGRKDSMQALKVAAYAFTPAWVMSVLHVIPALGILVLLAGLYSIYVLYLGLPVLMQAPKEKAGAYTVVVAVCAALIFVVIGAVASAFTRFGGPGPLVS